MNLISRFIGALSSNWRLGVLIGLFACWIGSGPLFGFSAEWQLMLNSFTTIIVLLVVFLVQGEQERAIQSMHLKLDAILQATGQAEGLVSLQEFSDSNLMRIEDAFRKTRGRPNVQEIVKEIESKSRSGPPKPN